MKYRSIDELYTFNLHDTYIVKMEFAGGRMEWKLIYANVEPENSQNPFLCDMCAVDFEIKFKDVSFIEMYFAGSDKFDDKGNFVRTEPNRHIEISKMSDTLLELAKREPKIHGHCKVDNGVCFTINKDSEVLEFSFSFSSCTAEWNGYGGKSWYSLINVAYNSKYQEYRKKYNYIFDEKYLIEIVTHKLTDELSIDIYRYEDKAADLYYHAHCELAQLKQGGEIIYSTRDIYSNSFYNLIDHQNGRQYLIFRIDLYGYSVLDLSTLKDYHYVPTEILNDGEAFIWTGVHYNRNTNLLVAEGCYWACPSGLCVLDFSNPASLPYPEYDLNQYLHYDDFEEMEFGGWDDKDHLIVRFPEKQNITRTIKKDVCFNLLRGKR